MTCIHFVQFDMNQNNKYYKVDMKKSFGRKIKSREPELKSMYSLYLLELGLFQV